MCKRLFLPILALLAYSHCFATVDSIAKQEFRNIVKLIKQDNIVELANLIEYPLKRETPIPDISNTNEFILYYPMLIDSGFKRKINSYNDSDIFEHGLGYGLVGGEFSGDIWINYESPKITAFNYSSKAEKILTDKLLAEEKRTIHPSVNKWTRDVIICRAKNTIIRIDETNGDLRYVAWTHGQKISEKPDLTLYKGVEDAQGTMGGWTYTFANGQWAYVIEQNNLCENPADCGLFLKVLNEGAEKSKVKMQEVKNLK